jgi:integrase
MARPAKPWHWKARGGWYATVRGERKLLARGGDEARAEAARELHRLLSVEAAPAGHPPAESGAQGVDEIVDRFYDFVADNLEPSTVETYRRRLREFRGACGKLEADKIRPRDVLDWLDTRAWGPTTRRTAIVIVRRAFTWSVRQGYLDRDPLTGLDKPNAIRRTAIPTQVDVQKLMAQKMTPQFRDFLEAVSMTGCRPGEAAKVEARDFDSVAGTWTIKGKTTSRTGRMRVVYLPPSVVATCRRLAALNPTGPLFRNSSGTRWKTQSYGKYFRRMREAAGVGPEVVACALRHLFATDALENGVPIATVSELLGHSGTAMVSKYYSHLSDRAAHLREALAKVRRDD